MDLDRAQDIATRWFKVHDVETHSTRILKACEGESHEQTRNNIENMKSLQGEVRNGGINCAPILTFYDDDGDEFDDDTIEVFYEQALAKLDRKIKEEANGNGH